VLTEELNVSQKQDEKAEPKERGPRVHYNYRRLKVEEDVFDILRCGAPAESGVAV
jgi:hypothetical protein